MHNWIILTAFTAGMALLVGATVYQGAMLVAETVFAEPTGAKWIVNEHFRGQ